MRSTEPLWRALEALPVLTGVREAWRECAGDAFPALEPFLRPTGRLAGTYPCPEPSDDGCPRGVVVHGEDDIVAVCRRSPRACTNRQLCRDDIVVYRLDLVALAQRLGGILGLRVDRPMPLDGFQRTVHVGSHRATATVSVPAFLTMQPGRGEFTEIAERLASRTGGRFLLLAPTSEAVTPAISDFLHSRGSAVLALADLTVLEERGALIASPVAGDLLRALGAEPARLSSHAVRADPPPHACVFRNQGATWFLAFDGRATTVEDSLGVRYVAELLRTPGVPVHTVRLRDLVAGEAPRALGDAGEILDKEALREFQQRLDGIREEQDEAREFQDFARGERLEEEAELLRRQIAQATGLGGRRRKASSDQERARVSVKQAVRRAMKAIAEVHPPLGRHLDQFVRTGSTLVYDPEPLRDWSM